MRKSALLLCLCLLLTPSLGFAQRPAAPERFPGKIPPVIFEGLHHLANQKPEEAEKSWFRDSPSAGQPVSNELRSLLEQYGAYQDFDLLSTQDVTPRLRILYLALNFEKQLTIVKFVTYRTTEGWVLLYRRIGIDPQIFETLAAPSQ